MKPITDLKKTELVEFLAGCGEPSYRATQIFEWLYRRYALSFEEMTNLPRELRHKLREHFTLPRLKRRRETVSAADGTTKYALAFADGSTVETVYLTHPRGATLCISSQVGCAFECKFCATGKMDLERNLSPGEIVDQVGYMEKHLSRASEDESPKEQVRSFSNLVFMGMGEPLANYDSLMQAIDVLIGEVGIGARRITISTCGIPHRIIKLADGPYELKLALSVNSPFDDERESLMPVAGRTPLAELMNAARYYFAKKSRLLTLEYVLLKDINDSTRHAHALASLMREVPAKVNLIAFNPFPHAPYARPERERIKSFQAVLSSRGKKVTLRKSLGCDILAGCGQLGAKTGGRSRYR
jgi:23S rRNA (adenine2503-C2)-methyltransferase